MEKFGLRIAERAFDPVEATREFFDRCRRSGAIVTFTGGTRDEGASIEALSLYHFPGFTEAGIRAIIEEAAQLWPLDDAAVIHRVGKIPVGEAIVFVAAAAAHRRPAFEAADFLMDFLKSRAPFWKQELSQNGARWIEPREQDYADAERWRNR